MVDDGVPALDLQRTLAGAAGEDLETIRLFDAYRSEALGPARRSLAFRLRVRSPMRTLDESDLAEIRSRVVEAARDADGAELRS